MGEGGQLWEKCLKRLHKEQKEKEKRLKNYTLEEKPLSRQIPMSLVTSLWG